MKVYRIIRDNKRSAIEIESQVDYDDVDLLTGPSTIKDNNLFKVFKGKKTFDALSYYDSLNWVFSEKVKNVFEENNVTGIEFYPIEIKDVEDNYYGFFLTGKGGLISSLDEKGRIDDNKKLEFNIEDWDGSDVFYFENSGATYITEKVKNLLEGNKISNIRINEEK